MQKSKSKVKPISTATPKFIFHTLQEEWLADTETPVSLYLKLQSKYSCLLESVEGGAVNGRYSIITREPDVVWRCREGRPEMLDATILPALRAWAKAKPSEAGAVRPFDRRERLRLAFGDDGAPWDEERVLDRYEFVGELSLTGELRPVRGTLAMTYAVSKVPHAQTPRGFVLPAENADEAALVSGIGIYPAKDLLGVVAHLEAEAGNPQARLIEPHRAAVRLTPPAYPDFFDVKGQKPAKRALEIAAAGGHSVLMVGPPGTGKTMLAQRFPGILPPMTTDEALESAAVLSLVGQFAPQRWAMRMFRSPHHTASAVALVGGGSHPMPGEISLAHHGVLFLDELPEFPRNVLELLRQPLEERAVVIARSQMTLRFPAGFTLVAAMNPCRCGYFGDPARECRCTGAQIQQYLGKISGPLLDRIDLHIEVPAVPFQELRTRNGGTGSAEMRQRVLEARARQRARGFINAEIPPGRLRELCPLDAAGERTLEQAVRRMALSARAHDRILKVARTIADLAGVEEIQAKHVAEAVQYRSLDRNYWT